MNESQERDIHIRIEMIIERSRHHEEMFLVDSKTAATNIIDLFKKENLLAKEVSVFEVSY